MTGLGLKAYLIRKQGVDGSPVNQYALFNLWNGCRAMAQFLIGGAGFQNIIRDFGRPAVRHWTGLACHSGLSRDTQPQAASRRLTPVPVDNDTDGTGLGLSAWIAREVEELWQLSRRDGVHTAASALDPHHWQLLRFVLWTETTPVPDEDATERYEVLHLSAPGLDALPNERAW